jgi:hypothetical protein
MKHLNKIILAYSIFQICIFPVDVSSEEIASIDTKIQKILKVHPEVSLKFLESKEKLFRSKHIDVYPDPKIGFAYRSYPYRQGFNTDRARPDTPGMTGNEYSFSQEVPYPGKLQIQKQILKSDSELDFWNGVWLQNEFLKSYFELVLSIAAIENELSDLQKIEKQMVTKGKLESSQYISENSNISNLLKTKNSVEKIRDRIIEKKITLEEYKKALLFFESHQEARGITEAEIIQYLSAKEIALETELSTDSLTKVPQIKFAEINQSKAIQESKKDEILHLPDFEVFVSYMQRRSKPFLLDSGPLNIAIMDNPEFSGDLWSAGVTVRVPVWSLTKISDLNQSNSIRVERLAREKEKERLRVKAEYQSTVEVWKGNKLRLDNYKKNLLPALQGNIKTSLAAYSKGDSLLGESYDFITDSLEMQSQLYQIQLKRWLSVLKLLILTNNLVPEGVNYEEINK